jgi:hypothetical protein
VFPNQGPYKLAHPRHMDHTQGHRVRRRALGVDRVRSCRARRYRHWFDPEPPQQFEAGTEPKSAIGPGLKLMGSGKAAIGGSEPALAKKIEVAHRYNLAHQKFIADRRAAAQAPDDSGRKEQVQQDLDDLRELAGQLQKANQKYQESLPKREK